MKYRNTKGRSGQLLRAALAGPALAGAALALAGLALTVATPASAGPVRYWAHIAAGADHTCGITARDGTLWCWGANDRRPARHRQHLRATTLAPWQVTTPAPGRLGQRRHRQANRTCAARTGRTVWCWGCHGRSPARPGQPRPTSDAAPGMPPLPARGRLGQRHRPRRSTPAPPAPAPPCGAGATAPTGELGTGGTGDAARTGPGRSAAPARARLGQRHRGRAPTPAPSAPAARLWCWGFGYCGRTRPRRQPTARGPAAPGHHPGPARAGPASPPAPPTPAPPAPAARLWCWGAQLLRRSSASDAHSSASEYLPAAGHQPGPGRLAASPPATARPARSAPTARCGAGVTTATASWASAPRITASLPQQVSTPARPGWAVVTAGLEHTCAIRTGHQLWCWGATSTASSVSGLAPTSGCPSRSPGDASSPPAVIGRWPAAVAAAGTAARSFPRGDEAGVVRDQPIGVVIATPNG